jgi:hypothetical protein
MSWCDELWRGVSLRLNHFRTPLLTMFSWKAYMGECTKETAFNMMDYFFENGSYLRALK